MESLRDEHPEVRKRLGSFESALYIYPAPLYTLWPLPVYPGIYQVDNFATISPDSIFILAYIASRYRQTSYSTYVYYEYVNVLYVS